MGKYFSHFYDTTKTTLENFLCRVTILFNCHLTAHVGCSFLRVCNCIDNYITRAFTKCLHCKLRIYANKYFCLCNCELKHRHIFYYLVLVNAFPLECDLVIINSVRWQFCPDHVVLWGTWPIERWKIYFFIISSLYWCNFRQRIFSMVNMAYT